MGLKMKPQKVIQRARELRAQQTKAERQLWAALRCARVAGLKFRRQHPIGPYFADFACLSQKLIVELDGGYHDMVADSDFRRQKFLEDSGWRVIRFSNEDVMSDLESVVRWIAQTLGIEYQPETRRRIESSSLIRRRRESQE